MKTRTIVPPVPEVIRYAMSGALLAIVGAALWLAFWITPELERR